MIAVVSSVAAKSCEPRVTKTWSLCFLGNVLRKLKRIDELKYGHENKVEENRTDVLEYGPGN